MKNWIILGALVIVSLTGFGQVTKNVLFLGNSYTGVNNLPQMVTDVAASANDILTFQSNTPGGYTLNGHSTNATSLNLIQTGGYDFVVLQEQSQIPSFPIGQVQTDCFPYATILDSIILEYNPCAETVFYMTWGRENGDVNNCPNWPPVCTYEGMDSLLRLRYDQMAVDNQGVLSPVGALWNYLRTNHPSIGLYAGDGSHPSLAGSYAAACSFYSTIFRKDPTWITTDLGLSASDALIIRNAAKAVVYDSLLTWHVGEYDPVADFPPVFQVNDNTVQFTNLSTNATSFQWDFGNGDSSTDVNPFYTYPFYGPYQVQLIAENCGFSDTIVQDVILVLAGLEENERLNIDMSPNPVKDLLTIQFQNADEINLFDAKGRKIGVEISKESEFYTIDFKQLPHGEYFILIRKEERSYSGKVVH